MIRTVPLPAAALILAGCMQSTDVGPASGTGAAAGAGASLASADGAPRGTARFSNTAGGISVQVEAQGLPAGVHGIHIHTTGRCEAPDFASAGPHWNPTGRQHGRDNPQGAHHGDLPNLTVGADGRGSMQLTTAGGSLAELLDPDGAALVIHANADDDRTDPSGNSGGRIACGVITRG
jgi:Cu-Zn family superoxide dismutase